MRLRNVGLMFLHMSHKPTTSSLNSPVLCQRTAGKAPIGYCAGTQSRGHGRSPAVPVCPVVELPWNGAALALAARNRVVRVATSGQMLPSTFHRLMGETPPGSRGGEKGCVQRVCARQTPQRRGPVLVQPNQG